MEFTHDNSWDHLTATFAEKLTAREAWNKFIDLHAQAVPKPYWAALKELSIEEEQKELVDWLQDLISASPLPESVAALWIGILKFADKGEEIPAIYVIGADTYSADDMDWACYPTYSPKDRYVVPDELKKIDEIAATDEDNYEFFDWILPLAYCTFMFDEIIRSRLDKSLFLKGKDKLFVAVGHDSGDYLDLSPLQ